MAKADDQSKRRQRLPDHPYPVLRVHHSGEFLDALERQLLKSTDWQLDTNHADHRAVVAVYHGDGFSGSGLGVSAYDLDFDHNTHANVISFATVAERWCRDEEEIGLVSDEDISAAFGLFLPIVRSACHGCSIRCRVIYPNPKKGRPLAKGAAERLTSFVRLANLAILHPSDWERFYRFVRYCHAHHVTLGQRRLCTELVSRGAPAGLAEELAVCYAHGRGVLSCRFRWIE